VCQEFRKRVYRKAALFEIAGSGTYFSETTKDEVLFKELIVVLQKLIGQLPPRLKEIFQLSGD
jgi:disulfide oxidoreductase YuzD